MLSISPRGCWEHPGVMGYQHPDCGFCWHGKDGLDVPTSGHGAAREPVCPRCQPPLPAGHVLVSVEDLRVALKFLACYVPLEMRGADWAAVERLAGLSAAAEATP